MVLHVGAVSGVHNLQVLDTTFLFNSYLFIMNFLVKIYFEWCSVPSEITENNEDSSSNCLNDETCNNDKLAIEDSGSKEKSALVELG